MLASAAKLAAFKPKAAAPGHLTLAGQTDFAVFNQQ